MLEGHPLHYQPAPPPAPANFSYFDRFHLTPMSDELLIPQSPQSDSEGSVSSLEGSSLKGIRRCRPPPHVTSKGDVRCQWRSCGIPFESLDQLASHVGRVHASSGPGGLFYCGWEGCTRNSKGFNARYKMLVHVRTHTNEKPHRCNQCDKSFSRAENLKIHARSHSGEKPYACPIPGCNKAYSNSSDRFKHTRTHQVDKPYQCKVAGCSKRYTDPSSLRKHVKTYKHFVDATPTDTNESRCCQHTCCTHVVKLGKFVQLKNHEWDKILDPFINEPKIFRPYDMDEMDVDGPLDLSMRKHKI